MWLSRCCSTSRAKLGVSVHLALLCDIGSSAYCVFRTEPLRRGRRWVRRPPSYVLERVRLWQLTNGEHEQHFFCETHVAGLYGRATVADFSRLIEMLELGAQNFG
jgi:hypothetical protein